MRFLKLAAIGAALVYFFDPKQGARRRNVARHRVLAFFRDHGSKQPKTYDDQTLKAKIESEVFRPADAPKGDVNVNVEEGVVYLRGQVERPELVGELEERVRSVQGVERVENLLHPPGTEAPMHQ